MKTTKPNLKKSSSRCAVGHKSNEADKCSAHLDLESAPAVSTMTHKHIPTERNDTIS